MLLNYCTLILAYQLSEEGHSSVGNQEILGDIYVVPAVKNPCKIQTIDQIHCSSSGEIKEYAN